MVTCHDVHFSGTIVVVALALCIYISRQRFIDIVVYFFKTDLKLRIASPVLPIYTDNELN